SRQYARRRGARHPGQDCARPAQLMLTSSMAQSAASAIAPAAAATTAPRWCSRKGADLVVVLVVDGDGAREVTAEVESTAFSRRARATLGKAPMSLIGNPGQLVGPGTRTQQVRLWRSGRAH